jgi:hypothetical protein
MSFPVLLLPPLLLPLLLLPLLLLPLLLLPLLLHLCHLQAVVLTCLCRQRWWRSTTRCADPRL